MGDSLVHDCLAIIGIQEVCTVELLRNSIDPKRTPNDKITMIKKSHFLLPVLGLLAWYDPVWMIPVTFVT